MGRARYLLIAQVSVIYRRSEEWLLWGSVGLTRSILVGILSRLPALLGFNPLPLQLSYTDVLPAASRGRLKVCGACNNSSLL